MASALGCTGAAGGVEQQAQRLGIRIGVVHLHVGRRHVLSEDVAPAGTVVGERQDSGPSAAICV